MRQPSNELKRQYPENLHDASEFHHSQTQVENLYLPAHSRVDGDSTSVNGDPLNGAKTMAPQRIFALTNANINLENEPCPYVGGSRVTILQLIISSTYYATTFAT